MEFGQQTKDGLIMVFDGGTQSIRCGVFDISGRMVDFVKIPIEPYFTSQPGFAEQDPEYFWQKLCESSRKLLGRQKVNKNHIKAVTVTTQRGVYINLDRQGKPLRPAISWLDQRQANSARFAPFHIETGLKLVGAYGVVDKLYRKGFCNWIRQYQPDVWEKTYKFVLLSGYFHSRLTDNFVESLGTNFGYLPIDRRSFNWARKNDIIWYAFPIEKEKLPELVKQGEIIGKITPQASADTGIPVGIPVIAGSCDKSCEVLGSGCLSSEVGCLSFGTCATVNAVTNKSVDLLPYLPPYPAAIPGYYVTEIPIDRGFWMVSWFKEQFGLKEQEIASQLDVSVESLFDELIKDIPPGSNGLILQPYWTPDRVYCDEFGRGGVIGFTDRHTRAHLYRAILEGLVYALKDGAKITTDKLKHPFIKLKVSGGGSQSQVAVQIAADVFNLSVEVPGNSETSALGAAMVCAVGLGYYDSYEEVVQGMTSVRQVVEPISRNRDLYDQLYNKVYRKMYGSLRPLYDEIAEAARKFPKEMNFSTN